MENIDLANILGNIVLPRPTINNKIFSSSPDRTVRQLRNNLLNQTVDRVNPVRYASLTPEQQTELAAYRTALLNVPQQAGFPNTIEWPTQPAWL